MFCRFHIFMRYIITFIILQLQKPSSQLQDTLSHELSLPFFNMFLHFNFAQTEKALELLGRFERIEGAQLNITEKYQKLLGNYGRDLEAVRKLYQKLKNEPPTARNLPPVAGRIAWARQLYRRIDGPMRVFKQHKQILSVSGRQ